MKKTGDWIGGLWYPREEIKPLTEAKKMEGVKKGRPKKDELMRAIDAYRSRKKEFDKAKKDLWKELRLIKMDKCQVDGCAMYRYMDDNLFCPEHRMEWRQVTYKLNPIYTDEEREWWVQRFWRRCKMKVTTYEPDLILESQDPFRDVLKLTVLGEFIEICVAVDGCGNVWKIPKDKLRSLLSI